MEALMSTPMTDLELIALAARRAADRSIRSGQDLALTHLAEEIHKLVLEQKEAENDRR
jgi:hypothetical protein